MKFFGAEFLGKLQGLAAPDGGLIAFNTIVEGAAERKKVVSALKTHAAGCLRFSSGMQEDLNEVFYLVQGEHD